MTGNSILLFSHVGRAATAWHLGLLAVVTATYLGMGMVSVDADAWITILTASGLGDDHVALLAARSDT